VTVRDKDSQVDAGLTVEPGETVKAPRIGECLVNLGCRLEWERSLYEGSNVHLFCGRVTAVAVHESLIACGPEERLRVLDLSYCVQGQINPLTGESLSPSRQMTILQHDLH
jgi:flavin reductase (DIM6/NTAB) family NADH-FMN oxidoreductase RutF